MDAKLMFSITSKTLLFMTKTQDEISLNIIKNKTKGKCTVFIFIFGVILGYGLYQLTNKKQI